MVRGNSSRKEGPVLRLGSLMTCGRTVGSLTLTVLRDGNGLLTPYFLHKPTLNPCTLDVLHRPATRHPCLSSSRSLHLLRPAALETRQPLLPELRRDALEKNRIYMRATARGGASAAMCREPRRSSLSVRSGRRPVHPWSLLPRCFCPPRRRRPRTKPANLFSGSPRMLMRFVLTCAGLDFSTVV